MAALQCEICGGKLIGKPGGLFECEFCGTEYSTEWARAKIQQIKGTVKVEGIVEVSGTVKIDGPVQVDNRANARNCALRAFQIIETTGSYSKNHYTQVTDILNDALKLDPECPEAHVGLLFREYWVGSFQQFKEHIQKHDGDCRGNPYYVNAEKYTRGTALHDQLMDLDAFIEENKKAKTYSKAVAFMEEDSLDAAREEFEKVSDYKDAAKLLDDCSRRMQQSARIGEAMSRLYRAAFPKGQKAVFSTYIAAVIRPDQTVDVWVDEKFPIGGQILAGVSRWTQIQDIYLCKFGNKDCKVEALVGLTASGRILAEGCEAQFKQALSQFFGVRQMKTDGDTLFFTDRTGTLYTSPFQRAMTVPAYHSQVMQWNNITAFGCKDGKFAAYNQKRKELAHCSDGAYTVVPCPKDVAEFVVDDSRVPRMIFTDGTLGTIEGDNIRVCENTYGIDCNGKFQLPLDENGTYKYGHRGEHKFTGVTEYFEVFHRSMITSGTYTYGVTKRGEAICGEKENPRSYDKKALAVYSCRNDGIFLLHDGSFVKCAVHRDSVGWYPVAKLRAFSDAEELKRLVMSKREQQESLCRERDALGQEMAELKGLFAGKRRKEIEARLAEIEKELKGLR